MKFQNNSVVFIHIPKTSGSYIERNLCKKFNCKKPWPLKNTNNLFGFYQVSNKNYLILQHLTINEMIKYKFLKKKKEQYIFTVIRNPYDRFFSLYKAFKKKYKTLNLFLDELEKLNLQNYKHNGIVSRNKINYKNFTNNLKNISYFFIPQYFYITNNKNYKVNIIKYDEIERINEILKLNLKFKPTENKNILTDVQKNRIYNLYKIDFDKLKFSRT